MKFLSHIAKWWNKWKGDKVGLSGVSENIYSDFLCDEIEHMLWSRQRMSNLSGSLLFFMSGVNWASLRHCQKSTCAIFSTCIKPAGGKLLYQCSFPCRKCPGSLKVHALLMFNQKINKRGVWGRNIRSLALSGLCFCDTPENKFRSFMFCFWVWEGWSFFFSSSSLFLNVFVLPAQVKLSLI